MTFSWEPKPAASGQPITEPTDVGHSAAVNLWPEITLWDLRNRSEEIMDAVECGQSFVVTWDGVRTAALIPPRHPRRFVSREEFAEVLAEDQERIAIREALAFGKAVYDARNALGMTVTDLPNVRG